MSARDQPLRRTLGNRRGETVVRNQHLRRACRGAQRFAEHVQKHLRGCARRRRVQRSEAQRRPEVVPHARRQIPQQLRNRRVVIRSEAGVPLTREPADRRDPFAPRQPGGAQHAGEQSERCGQVACAKRQRVGLVGRERPDPQRRPGPGRYVVVNDCRQCERIGIGAEQQMLTVVERQSVPIHRARAATERGSGFVQLDAVPAARELDGSGASRPATADDRNHARQAARVAIHSLRSGVSAIRRSSTRNPSRAISSSSVR